MFRSMSRICLAIIVLSTLLISPAVVHADPETTNCLYPSPSDRFGVTVYADQEITDYDLSPLGAGRYLNWRADETPAHPEAMSYYFMVRVRGATHSPAATDLRWLALQNPGATWIIGNEADVIWQDNTTPEAYAQAFHSAYSEIKAVDPTARFVMNGIVQVSPLRLAWLNLVLDSYRSQYGGEIPVDIWNIHTYVANEMHQEWGFEIPPGIDNAVGYTVHLGTQWSQVNASGASGGTVHQSKTRDSRAYFAFRGDNVTIFLRSGPDAGIAQLFLDQSTTPAVEIDLYAPTAGTVSRTFANLPPPGGILQDRHNIRVRVTGRTNPAASDAWVRVDAMQASSTASLPGGRFEDNNPLRAMIVTTVDDHDNIDLVTQQIRVFRQWMRDHGQRDKPLINTEYGILMTEDIGFDYPRVRTFMLSSFDRFLNSLVDPTLGYPADDNRMLQEWFWFALAINDFEGRVTRTGLYDSVTHAIKPLGNDFANYVRPRKVNYVDLALDNASITPYWPIFAGAPSLLHVESWLRNLGNLPSGPFDVAFRAGNGSLLATQPFTGLPRRYEPGFQTVVSYDWQVLMTGPRSVTIIADESNQVAEPCQPNNQLSLQVTPPPGTDLALINLRTDPAPLPPVPPGGAATVPVKVDLRNLGSVGTAASQVEIKLWNGDPNAGGTLIGVQTLTPGNVSLPATITLPWPNVSPGWYTLYARVEPAPEETDTQNNTVQLTLLVPGSVVQLPLAGVRYTTPRPHAAQTFQQRLAWTSLLPADTLPATGP